MASSTKIRPFARLLDECEAPLWVIGPTGHLVYLSTGCAKWLGIDVDSLLDRRSVSGVAVSDDPLDRLAASLSPPPGLGTRGTASLRVQPPVRGDHRPTPLEVRYVRVGSGALAITIAVAGPFDDRMVDSEWHDAVALRQRLDAWRKRNATLATIAAAGVSASSRRMRRRIRVAAATRTDVGLFGPIGCGSEWIARHLHQLSAPGEALLVVDGPLMDGELMDATLMPMRHQLAESSQSRGSILVRGLDETPIEAQQRLVSLIDSFADRIRLLALCSAQPLIRNDSSDSLEDADLLGLNEEMPKGICGELCEILSSMTVVCPALENRIEDIPMIATALLDQRHAAGEGTGERLSRSALDALVIYPWPRNLEELDEAIRHAVRTASAPSIGVEYLPLAIRSYRPGEPNRGGQGLVPLDVATKRFQRRLLVEALQASRGNRAEAARRLGISRTRLLRKLEEVAEDASSQEEDVE